MTISDDEKRFSFGANWARFLSVLDEEKIRESERSLCEMLNVETLSGRSFLDIGSGSGLSSLAARRLGAKVHSFDYDPKSVACTAELRRRYRPDDVDWSVEQGSALDAAYLQSLGRFDIVYSWGVLHHTGAMWLSIENAIGRVADGGQLFVAIYNDVGWWSRVWWLIKHAYNKFPRGLRSIYAFSVWYGIITLNIVKHTVLLSPMRAIRPFMEYKPRRGMSKKYDILDWVGGLPYEFASHDVLVAYFKSRHFDLINSNPSHGHGCHELVLRKQKAIDD